MDGDRLDLLDEVALRRCPTEIFAVVKGAAVLHGFTVFLPASEFKDFLQTTFSCDIGWAIAVSDEATWNCGTIFQGVVEREGTSV